MAYAAKGLFSNKKKKKKLLASRDTENSFSSSVVIKTCTMCNNNMSSASMSFDRIDDFIDILCFNKVHDKVVFENFVFAPTSWRYLPFLTAPWCATSVDWNNLCIRFGARRASNNCINFTLFSTFNVR